MIPNDRFGPQVGPTQQRILELLKRRGSLTVGEIGDALDLSAGTVREHLNALGSIDLVARCGTRRDGPGRPYVLYALTPAAERLFPDNSREMLTELVRYLVDSKQIEILERFFVDRVEARKKEALARVHGMTGRERTEEVARIMSENGFMAEVVNSPGGALPVLKLCHCPIRDAVSVTRLPCAAELNFVRELLGESLLRTDFMPAGGHSCSYEGS